jgi:hypothetical protein
LAVPGDPIDKGANSRRKQVDLDGKTGRLRRKTKKEEFPGTMRSMPTGNSFPQICVVSEHILDEVKQK